MVDMETPSGMHREILGLADYLKGLSKDIKNLDQPGMGYSPMVRMKFIDAAEQLSAAVRMMNMASYNMYYALELISKGYNPDEYDLYAQFYRES